MRRTALVVVAGPDVAAQMRSVKASGWAGPVVLVGSAREAHELVRGPSPRPGLMIDPERRVAVAGGGEVGLTELEVALLRMLLAEPGRVHAYADIVAAVWGTRHLGPGVAQVHSVVKRVRRKLDSIASPVELRAVRGTGLRAVARPRPSLPPG